MNKDEYLVTWKWCLEGMRAWKRRGRSDRGAWRWIPSRSPPIKGRAQRHQSSWFSPPLTFHKKLSKSDIKWVTRMLMHNKRATTRRGWMVECTSTTLPNQILPTTRESSAERARIYADIHYCLTHHLNRLLLLLSSSPVYFTFSLLCWQSINIQKGSSVVVFAFM